MSLYHAGQDRERTLVDDIMVGNIIWDETLFSQLRWLRPMCWLGVRVRFERLLAGHADAERFKGDVDVMGGPLSFDREDMDRAMAHHRPSKSEHAPPRGRGGTLGTHRAELDEFGDGVRDVVRTSAGTAGRPELNVLAPAARRVCCPPAQRQRLAADQPRRRRDPETRRRPLHEPPPNPDDWPSGPQRPPAAAPPTAASPPPT